MREGVGVCTPQEAMSVTANVDSAVVVVVAEGREVKSVVVVLEQQPNRLMLHPKCYRRLQQWCEASTEL